MPGLARVGWHWRKLPIPIRVLLLNMFATSLWTVGVFAALCAGYLEPDLRVTASSLSSVVNGLATIALFVVVDPQVSMITDEAAQGEVAQADFRRAIFWLISSRFAGTLLAHAFLVPSAVAIAWVATKI